MSESKTKKVALNSFVGIITQLFQMVLSFATRTIFIKLLGADYLGINGIYTNVLSILSITELGIGNILIFYLYKPLVNKDNQQIVKIINFSKKAYYFIALSIFIIGILLVPALPMIITSDLSNNDLIKYYLVFLMNSVISYIYIYKTNLLIADQKTYKMSLVNSLVVLLQYILQIFILLLFKNYMYYLLVLLFSTFLNNFLNSKIADKNYKYLNDNKLQLLPEEKKQIIGDIKSMFVYKLGTVIMNYTDNILISIFVGTIYVGYYSNYLLVLSMINTFLSIIIKGITGSIGNLIAEGNKKRIKETFYIFVYLFQSIGIICSISLIYLFNDFINIWIGKGFILDKVTVSVIVISFYLTCTSNQNWIFREAAGLYKNVRAIMIIAAILNLVFSIILGQKYGLWGVLIATVIAKMLTIVWFDPFILTKKLLNDSFVEYIYRQGIYLIQFVLLLILGSWLQNILVDSLLQLILKGILYFCIISLVYLLVNIPNKYQKLFFRKIFSLLSFRKRNI